jgi:hypothetical protein
MDAGGFCNRVGPRDAYRLTRGEEPTASTGQPVRLSRPFDWLAIVNHSNGLGLINDLLTASPIVKQFEQDRRLSLGFPAGGQEAVNSTLDLIGTLSRGKMDPDLIANYSAGAWRYATI